MIELLKGRKEMEPKEERALPSEIIERLVSYNIHLTGEVELRQFLETHAPTFTLYRLAPAAARKWKARYRIMIGDTYLDCQSVTEAYARALLLTLDAQSRLTSSLSAPPSS